MQRFFSYGFIGIFMLLSASLEREPNPLGTRDSSDIRIAIIDSEHGGYGYDIFVKEKLHIHQPHIPAIASTIGFASKDDATKIAMVVVGKMRQNETPPTVTVDEIQSLIRE